MPNPHDPRLHFSGRSEKPEPPDEPAAEDEATFRLLDREPGSGEATFRLLDREPDGTDGGFGADGGEPTRATVLDPDSWSSEVAAPAPPPTYIQQPQPQPSSSPSPPSQAPEPTRAAGSASGPTYASPPPAGLRRFGPGVPGPDTSAGTAQTAAVWHGTVRPADPADPANPVVPPDGRKRRGRGLRRWLLPLVVLLAVLAYLLWQRLPGSVEVDAVSVHNATAVQGCHTTAKVVGTLTTSGGSGTVHYRWHRSDGTVSDDLSQHVGKGHRTTDVVLLWSFDGPGSLKATATLEVLTPRHRTAATTFTYRCS